MNVKTLADGINAALRKMDKHGQPEAEVLERLLADIKALGLAEPALGHELAGRYHCLAGNAAVCREEYGKALEAAPDSPSLLSNYGAALCRLHCLHEGLSFLLKARARGGRDLPLLNRLIYTLYQLGQRDKLALLFKEYTSITGERHEIEDWEE